MKATCLGRSSVYSVSFNRLADFLALGITNPNDRNNMTGYIRAQITSGYIPPEVLRQSVFPGRRFAIREWTNIWQIGRVIEAMMKLVTGFRSLTYSGSDLEPQIINWQGQYPGQFYSPHLRAAVASCLRFRPDRRATARTLLDLIDNNPDWRLYQRDMQTFGSDAWFEEQERQQQQQAAQAATAAPTNATPSAPAERHASTKKRKRMEDAKHYLRAWGRDKAAKFDELGVLPSEAYDLEYPDSNLFWATDDHSLVHSGGRLERPLAYQPEGHTVSIGFSNLAIGSSTPAGDGDADVSMQDVLDGDEDGNSTIKANDGDSTIKANQGGHGGYGVYNPDPGESPWIMPHPESKYVDGGGEENEGDEEDDEEDDNGADDFHHNISSEPLMFRMSEDAAAVQEGRENDGPRADDEYEGIEEEYKHGEDGEEDDDDDDDDAYHYRSSDFPALPVPPQNDPYHSSDLPWLIGADDLAEDDEQEDIDEQEVNGQAEDVDSKDDRSVYYTASSDPPPYNPQDPDILRDEDPDDEPEDWKSAK